MMRNSHEWKRARLGKCYRNDLIQWLCGGCPNPVTTVLHLWSHDGWYSLRRACADCLPGSRRALHRMGFYVYETTQPPVGAS